MKVQTLPFAARSSWEGVANIVRFNRPLYLRSVLVIAGVGIFVQVPWLPPFLKIVGTIVMGISGFYLVASLIVSHWIYDRSALYDLDWLERAVRKTPDDAVNLTSGFDETTLRLKNRYPKANFMTLDFYDPERHTEPSIARARAYRPPLPEVIPVQLPHLNLLPGSLDLALGILALHEIRDAEERANLFVELAAALRPGGRCIVVEHLRDWANFLAFGPGFLHFFARKAWLKAAITPTLKLVDEFSITPFIRVFVLEKSDA